MLLGIGGAIIEDSPLDLLQRSLDIRDLRSIAQDR